MPSIPPLRRFGVNRYGPFRRFDQRDRSCASILQGALTAASLQEFAQLLADLSPRLDLMPRAQFDGSFAEAFGHATCKKGERVISGGVRQTAGGAGVISHIWTVESEPIPKKRGWYVSMNSDLGGAARTDFLVVANCERK